MYTNSSGVGVKALASASAKNASFLYVLPKTQREKYNKKLNR